VSGSVSAEVGSVGSGLDHFFDLRIPARIELGRKRITVAELNALQSGDVLELNAKVGTPLELIVNGARVAQGEVVITDNRYGLRITKIYSVRERQRPL